MKNEDILFDDDDDDNDNGDDNKNDNNKIDNLFWIFL